MKTIIVLVLLLPTLAFSHGGGLDKQGGHFNRKAGTYECHREPCFSIHEQAEEAYQQAVPGTYSDVYDRDDWPHWVDDDNDCQDLRHELLIETSMVEVEFTDSSRCIVKTGQWYGVYTGRTFTEASDIHIDHVVPLAHAHRHGGHAWSREKKKKFANDPENLLIVEGSVNLSKSDQAPHEWLPPNQDYWCEYGKLWEYVKDKYALRYGQREREVLRRLGGACP